MADDGSHLDGIQMPDFDDAFVDPDGPIEIGEDGAPLDLEPEKISREAFFVVFETAFSIPGMVVNELKPLAVNEDEKPAARAAADATYSLLEIYYPSALLPQSETLAHLMVAGPFFIGKAMVIREIVRARNAKPVPQEPQKADTPEPANDNKVKSGDPMAFMDQEREAG